ncbi:MAG: hypothetical protein A3J76_02660 [Candidatus Moranbacteria bacterium RBG_13_45_13]|nr:MAG: hypothetical protein A3J76_02660 [Candidatus Moranbacteria bacterium RBG_13_45_13]
MKRIKNVQNKFFQIEHNFITSLRVNDYDNISEIYDETMGKDFSNIIFSSHRSIIQKNFTRNQKLKCLDIACGTGSFIRRLAREFGNRVDCYGVDLSKGQIRIAKKLAEIDRVKVRFSVGNIIKTKFPSDCDVITINLDATNHLKQPEHWKILFSKVYDSLKPGGIYLFDINTPKRLFEDLVRLEVIIKKDITYVQCGIKTGFIDDFALNQHLMQIFHKNKTGIKEYFALIQQIAPSRNKLFEMLKRAGFSKVKEIRYSKKIRAKHIFMKNRLFVMCRK